MPHATFLGGGGHADRISEGVKKSYGGTAIVIPVEKVPQERKTQESGGFLQE